jgi:hypothetical protein
MERQTPILPGIFLYEQVTNLQRNEPLCNIFSFTSKGINIMTSNIMLIMRSKCCTTRWFKYDQDKLWLVYTQIVPVISEPPCIKTTDSSANYTEFFDQTGVSPIFYNVRGFIHDTVLSDWRQQQHFGDWLHLHNQGSEITHYHSKWLSAQENYTEFCRCENYETSTGFIVEHIYTLWVR